MTGQPQVNGTRRPDVPRLGAFTPIAIGGMPAEPPAWAAEAAPSRVDVVAEAQAEAIRARAHAEAEAARIAAEAEAEAVRVKAVAEAEKLRLLNERNAMRMEKDREEHEARLADIRKRREAAEREAEAARAHAAVEQEAAAAEQEKKGKSARSWRRSALGFAAVCAIVALPVQMSAFYNPHLPWLLAAPVFLEGLAWVVLKGAAAAVDDHRPYWHYRLIAWLGAFTAAAINFSHGITHFDLATAVGTAFASVAGPGVWDLHEHGRIRKRDGVLTRRERKAQEKVEAKAAAERAAEGARAEAEKKAAAMAAEESAQQLAAEREKTYPKEWEHALALRAALGETTVTEAVWRRAWYDLHGTEPGDSVDTIRTRKTAERRVEMARGETPAATPSKVTGAQRANQMPRPQRGPARKPPVRRRGDTAPYVQAARNQAAITAKNAARAADEN